METDLRDWVTMLKIFYQDIHKIGYGLEAIARLIILKCKN